jgi:hypothetical protein
MDVRLPGDRVLTLPNVPHGGTLLDGRPARDANGAKLEQSDRVPILGPDRDAATAIREGA